METKEVYLNKPQADIHLVNANKTYAMWGRATGKSNGALGPRIVHLFNKMPRAQIGFTAPSYKMAFTNILPQVLGFLQNEMNLFEGENYVIGRQPPDEWPQPIIPIFDHKYVLSFDNGCAMPVLSLEAEGSGNGLNLQANVGDEAKFFKEKKLKEAIRAIRGGNKQFGHLAEFQSQWYFTDKYDGDIEWLLAKRKLMDPKLIDAVIRLQLELNELYRQPLNEELQNKIINYENILTKTRRNLVYVSEASAEENRMILGDKFFTDQMESSDSQFQYDVAIGNKDPDRVENSFYPSLTEINEYFHPVDVDASRPLIIALDYQWRISPLVVAQVAELPGNNRLSLNYVRDFHALHPDGIVSAIDKFCHHFKNRPNKIVYYLFDKTATSKNPTSQPFYETVIERLRHHGWAVIEEHMGEPPLHSEKFKTINLQLKGEEAPMPIFINKIKCADMLRSMKLAPAMQYNGKTSKDKRSEKNLSFPALKSTHFSDVFDMIIHGVLDLNLIPHNQGAGLGMIIS